MLNQTKSAKRCESVLNALLVLSFTVSFTKIINTMNNMLNKTQVSDFKLVALQALIFDYLHPESNTPLWGNATNKVGTDIVENQVTKAWEISQRKS